MKKIRSGEKDEEKGRDIKSKREIICRDSQNSFGNKFFLEILGQIRSVLLIAIVFYVL